MVILWLKIELIVDPPPPQKRCALTTRLTVAVFSELPDFHPRFLPSALEGDANSIVCVLSSSAASQPENSRFRNLIFRVILPICLRCVMLC